MSIQTELQRIKTNVSNTLNAIQAHGGVVPLDANSNDMATCVKTIPTGTGGLTNLLDGTAEGSLRSAGSAPETDDYKLGKNAVSLGYNTKASGMYSIAEGGYTEAQGTVAHAEGSFSKAIADYTHAEGMGTIAASQGQHVQGKNNIEDADGKYLHIVGNGVNADQRKNAHTIDTEGNAWYSGDVFVGGTGQDDTKAEKLVKKSELDKALENVTGSGETESFIINVNDDEGTVTVDKTIAEITEAHSAGKTLICALKAKKAIDSTSWHSLESDIPFDRNIGTELYRFTRFVGASSLYDNSNYIRVDIKLDAGETTATINGERYARKSEVPTVPSVLPNPYGLTINVNGTQTSYNGSQGKTVFIDIPDPVTSLPWSAITDVPFRAGGIALDETLTVPMGDGQWPILTPFSIKDGRVYTVTIGENTYEDLTAQTTYMEPDVPESKVVFLGNPYFVGGENNNLLFILVCLETPPEEAGVSIYGLIMGAGEEFMQSTLYVKIDGGETILLDPELIPTMSETVKGGAKVGEGLEVVDGALSVVIKSPSGKRFRLTVDDSGTLTAVEITG